MELAIPLVALGSLYVINNQKKPNSGKNKEGFANRALLPNSDIPDANYSPTLHDETTYTSKLSTVNKYNGGAYTDKYFSPESGSQYSNNSVENKDASYYSLTGNKVDKDYFQHNNMVPFFGSTVRSTFTDSNTNESILDKTVVNKYFDEMDDSQILYILKERLSQLRNCNSDEFKRENDKEWF